MQRALAVTLVAVMALGLAPHSRWRAEVTPAGRGKPRSPDRRTPAERHRAMTSCLAHKKSGAPKGAPLSFRDGLSM